MPQFAVFFSDGAGYGFEMVQALDAAHAVGNLADRLSLSGASEKWPRSDTKSGPSLRATDQAQRHDRGAVTSGAELPGCGVGNT